MPKATTYKDAALATACFVHILYNTGCQMALLHQSLVSQVEYIFILFALITLGTVLYRIYFHPLAKYPGPFLGKFTNIWAVYHGSKGDLAQTLEKWHRKHGEFIRFGPNRISANSIEALENIYGFKANTRKSKWYYTFAIDPARPSTHTVIDKVQHARKRRLIAQGLSTKATKEIEPQVIECIDVLSEKLCPSDLKKGKWSDAKDMAAWSSYLTADIMGAMVFSKRFGLMEHAENRWIKDAIPLSSRNKYACGFMPWIIQYGFDRLLWPDLTNLRLKLRSFGLGQLQQRFARKDDEKLNDIFRCILNATDPDTGESFGERELGSEANLLIAAGGDTTSTAIASTFFFLTKNDNILDKVTEEVRNKFKTLEDVRPGSDLTSCTYLRACVDESMRIAPPVPSVLMREVLEGGININRHFFPQGAELAVPAFVIHRNPGCYPEPLEYRPERWIGNVEKDKHVQLAQSAFCPFSIGPRSCVGRSMGYLEMTTTIARLLWSMDVRRQSGNILGEDYDGTYAMLDGFVAEKYGPMVEFRRRDV